MLRSTPSGCSSAKAIAGFWAEYSIDADCDLAGDGSLFRYGDHLTISGPYPRYRVVNHTDHLRIDLELDCSDVLTHFIHAPMYRHLSLLTWYSGTIDLDDQRFDVAGLCTFEHAVALGPHSLLNRRLPNFMNVPLDFFTYQVLDRDEGWQLLLVATQANGHDALNGAYLRHPDGTSTVLDKAVRFEMLQAQPPPGITPDGHPMPLPLRFRWTSPADSPIHLDLEGTVDTPFNWASATDT